MFACLNTVAVPRNFSMRQNAVAKFVSISWNGRNLFEHDIAVSELHNGSCREYLGKQEYIHLLKRNANSMCEV